MVQPMAAGKRPGSDGSSLENGPSEVLGQVIKELHRSDLADHTVQRMAELMARFTNYLEKGHGLRSVSDIAEEHVEGFLFASTFSRKGKRRPSVATMHLRRAALRLYFQIAGEIGIALGDLTTAVLLPPRSGLQIRALMDDEIVLCRSCSLSSPSATHPSAAWALAEASARTSEIPRVRLSDVDIDCGRVWLHGSPKARPRWGNLTSWGAKQLTRRIEALRSASSDDLVLLWKDGSEEPQAGAICKAVGDILVRSGLDGESDVRPLSIVGWVGRTVFEETGHIEVAAQRMGMRSLDRAARLIGWDWNGDNNEDGVSESRAS